MLFNLMPSSKAINLATTLLVEEGVQSGEIRIGRSGWKDRAADKIRPGVEERYWRWFRAKLSQPTAEQRAEQDRRRAEQDRREAEGLMPFDLVLCGGPRCYWGVRQGRRVFRGTTPAEALAALAGMWDPAECYWYGMLGCAGSDPADRQLVLDQLGWTPEEARKRVADYRREWIATHSRS
jgi:hypothetical protein